MRGTPVVEVYRPAEHRHAPFGQAQAGCDQVRHSLDKGAMRVVLLPEGALLVGDDRGQKQEIDAPAEQVHRMPVHQFDREARLSGCVFPGVSHDAWIGRVRDHDVGPQLGEETVPVGKEVVEQERSWDADAGTAAPFGRGLVPSKQQFLPPTEQVGQLGRSLLPIQIVSLTTRAVEQGAV